MCWHGGGKVCSTSLALGGGASGSTRGLGPSPGAHRGDRVHMLRAACEMALISLRCDRAEVLTELGKMMYQLRRLAAAHQ
eukprot:726925-Pyramimonas_sp.AAC.1